MRNVRNLILKAGESKNDKTGDNGDKATGNYNESMAVRWIPNHVVKTFYSWIDEGQRKYLDDIMSSEIKLLNYSLKDIYWPLSGNKTNIEYAY